MKDPKEFRALNESLKEIFPVAISMEFIVGMSPSCMLGIFFIMSSLIGPF